MWNEPCSSGTNTRKIVDYSDSSSDELITLSEPEALRKRSRKGHANVDNWVSIKNKRKREQGLPYKGLKKNEKEKWKYAAKKPGRTLKARCSCRSSRQQTKIKCHELKEEDRVVIKNNFWNLSWPEKQIFVQTNVEITSSKDIRNRKDLNCSRRSKSLKYYLVKDNNRLRVCKKMFNNTLSVGEWTVLNWINKNTKKMNSKQSKSPKGNHKRGIEVGKEMKQFLDLLPKLDSHYCRS